MPRLDVLQGVRVVGFGDLHAASVAAYHLALAGARVVLAEPSTGCEGRLAAAGRGKALFDFTHRGGQSATVDAALATPPDVLLLPAYPDATVAGAIAARRAMSAWHRTLFVDFREADGTQLTELTAQAECGLTAFFGHTDAPPLRAGFEMVGHSAGMLAVAGIAAALMARGAAGPGQSVRVPLSRAAAGILNNVITASIAPEQPTHFSQGWAHDPSAGVMAADGAFEVLFYGTQAAASWTGFCVAIGAPELAGDARFDTHAKRLDHPAELAQALSPFTCTRPQSELVDAVRRCGGMAMPKHTVAQAVAWEQSRANGLIGGDGLPTAPWVLNGVRADVAAAS